MPQVIAGTGSALSKTIAKLVKELLDNNWPTAAYDPVKADVTFGLGTWDNYGDIDIHVNTDVSTSQAEDAGGTMSKIVDPVLIKIYVRKNTEEVPDTVGSAQRKAEEIIKDNMMNLGQGIPLIRFDGWNEILEEDNLKDVWQTTGRASAIYWLAKT
jgi:hypothetical protein